MGGKGEFRWRLSMLVGKRGVVCEGLCLNSRGGEGYYPLPIFYF